MLPPVYGGRGALCGSRRSVSGRHDSARGKLVVRTARNGNEHPDTRKEGTVPSVFLVVRGSFAAANRKSMVMRERAAALCCICASFVLPVH